jgi:hypothetical protein
VTPNVGCKSQLGLLCSSTSSRSIAVSAIRSTYCRLPRSTSIFLCKLYSATGAVLIPNLAVSSLDASKCGKILDCLSKNPQLRCALTCLSLVQVLDDQQCTVPLMLFLFYIGFSIWFFRHLIAVRAFCFLLLSIVRFIRTRLPNQRSLSRTRHPYKNRRPRHHH